MCPNAECAKHRQPTGLMGGCDCGTALVPFKTEDEETREALWDLMPAGTKRLVTYMMLARIDEGRTKRGAG